MTKTRLHNSRSVYERVKIAGTTRTKTRSHDDFFPRNLNESSLCSTAGERAHNYTSPGMKPTTKRKARVLGRKTAVLISLNFSSQHSQNNSTVIRRYVQFGVMYNRALHCLISSRKCSNCSQMSDLENSSVVCSSTIGFLRTEREIISRPSAELGSELSRKLEFRP
mgnify:CR=1 FL=1